MSEKQKSKGNVPEVKGMKEVEGKRITNVECGNGGRNVREGNFKYELHHLKLDLEQRKKIYYGLDLSKLPDRGARLKKKIDDIQSEIKNTENVISCNLSERNNAKGDTFSTTKAVSKSSVFSKSDHHDTENTDDEVEVLYETNYSKGKTNHLVNPENNKVKNRAVGPKDTAFNMKDVGEALSDVISCKLDKSSNAKIDVSKTVECRNDEVLNNLKVIPSTKQKLIKDNDRTGDALPSHVRKDLSFSDLIAKDDTGCSSVSNVAKDFGWTEWRESSENARHIKLVDAQELPNPCLEKESKPGSNAYFTYLPISKPIGKEQLLKLHNCLKTMPSESDEENEPTELRTKLMKHQRQALAWLLWREQQEPRGGIFADDMGLGKTLTMISLVLKQQDVYFEDATQDLRGAISSSATLIVCLASVIHQWNGEVVKHCHEGSLNVVVHHGKNRNTDAKWISKHDIVLTTYGLIQSEGKSLSEGKKIPPLFKIHWKRIILDEAHTIKNEKSLTSKSICLLNSSCRWAVTGTPIHNNLNDMYGLLKFLQCHPFDDYKVWKKLAGDHSDLSADRLNALIKSILLRRCKADCDKAGKPLIKLPKKCIITHKLELEKSERVVYDELYNESKAKLINYLDSKTSAVGSAVIPQASNTSFLVILLRLQQCCNHISLLGKDAEDEVTLNDSAFSDIADSISSLSIRDVGNPSPSPKCESNLNLSLDKYKSRNAFPKSLRSTKVKVLFEELNKISALSGKQKSVVVSQWVSMLEIIEYHLKECGMQYHIIKGSTKPEDRTVAVNDFNENPDGPKIMLLSLKAGGVGLNLIGANHLFLLDIHWNPALESQASDRIYRVGQKLDSFIHKFVCQDTIEAKILSLQESKRYLAKNTLEGSGKNSQKPSFEDLRHLFNV